MTDSQQVDSANKHVILVEISGTKKTAAAEAVKSFNAYKDEYNKVFEERKTELQPKVVEIYWLHQLKSRSSGKWGSLC
ncbi:hypothetical protein L6164_028518 [Bauhinia variegata]|uniref:Uncharacterized protein n=1 Tax=Bauhinia variegata TaxID=167791 RepID=A0ACB9L679_BAUVA|nr:hypothetical protein L6164_028518 [Bauhinia variegata]